MSIRKKNQITIGAYIIAFGNVCDTFSWINFDDFVEIVEFAIDECGQAGNGWLKSQRSSPVAVSSTARVNKHFSENTSWKEYLFSDFVDLVVSTVTPREDEVQKRKKTAVCCNKPTLRNKIFINKKKT